MVDWRPQYCIVDSSQIPLIAAESNTARPLRAVVTTHLVRQLCLPASVPKIAARVEATASDVQLDGPRELRIHAVMGGSSPESLVPDLTTGIVVDVSHALIPCTGDRDPGSNVQVAALTPSGRAEDIALLDRSRVKVEVFKVDFGQDCEASRLFD